MNSYSFSNPAFGSLVVYGGLLLTKTALMTALTVYFRKKNKSVASPEDAKYYLPGKPERQKLLLQPKEEVERVRSSCYVLLFVEYK